MRFNIFFILGLLMIAVIVGMAVGDIGEIPNCSENPYGIELPLSAAAIMGVPFVVGYLAGKEENQL